MANLVQAHTSRTEKAVQEKVIKLSKQYTALETLRAQGTVINVTLQDVQDALLDGIHALKAVQMALDADADAVDVEATKAVAAESLSPEWCRCADQEGDIIYPQDGECRCGMFKHHVHRLACGHVTQVG